MYRRDLLKLSGLALSWRAAGATFSTVVAERVERAFATPGKAPNGLQATREGLWVVDQATNRVALVRWSDGGILRELATGTDRPSGITFDGEALWVASTYNRLLVRVDARTGKTLRELPTPGAGVVKWVKPGPKSVATGAHGLEWRQGELWVAVPPSATIYALNPEDGRVLRSFSAPGVRPHGIGWDPDGSLWCAESIYRSFFKMDPRSGRILRQLMLPFTEPQAEGMVLVPHGATVWDGRIWFCVAETGEVYRLPLA